MSLSLFNAAPVGAIEVLFDKNNQPLFKRADLGRYLGIAKVRNNEISSHLIRKRIDIEGAHTNGALLGPCKNPHDIFVTLDGAIYIASNSKKEKASALILWLVKKGIEKIQEEHQQAIEKKDAALALLNDDLTEAQEHTRQLEFNNVGLQGEIRAKDQVIEDLIINRHVPRREDADNVLCIIDKMSTEPHQYYAIRRQSKSLEVHLRQLRRRYPNMVEVGRCDDANAVHHWCRFKDDVIQKPNYYKNHFNLTPEKRELFETAFDLTIEQIK